MPDIIPIDKKKAIEKDLLIQAEAIKTVRISDEETAQGASTLLATLSAKVKRIKDLRLESTKELRQEVKDRNDAYSVYENAFSRMVDSLKPVIKAWIISENERIRKEQEVAEAKAIKSERIAEEQRKKAEDKGEPLPEPLEEEIKLVPVTEKKSTNMQTSAGLVGSQKRWTYEIIDEKKVPSKYKMVNRPEITKAVRNGEREIKGVRIFEDVNVTVR